jgi:hypothetical protein
LTNRGAATARLLVAAATILAAVPGSAEKKVAATSAECPADLPVRRVDATDKADVCAQEAGPACAEGLTPSPSPAAE